MSTSDLPSSTSNADASPPKASTSRRKFLGHMGGATAGAIALGSIGLEPLLGIEGSIAQAAEITPTSDAKRLSESFKIRSAAAKAEQTLGLFPHPTNGDEELYPNRI